MPLFNPLESPGGRIESLGSWREGFGVFLLTELLCMVPVAQNDSPLMG